MSGCAPTLETFLEPRAPGGEITTRMCPPLPDVMLFRREGVVVAVFLGRVESGRRTIWFSFQVPRGRTVRLLGSSLEVTTASGDRVRCDLTGKREGSRRRTEEVHPESLMVGRTERLRYGTRTGYSLTPHELYEFTTEFATPLGDAFTVTLPGVVVNGFSWDLPPVRFARVRRWVISPFNC